MVLKGCKNPHNMKIYKSKYISRKRIRVGERGRARWDTSSGCADWEFLHVCVSAIKGYELQTTPCKLCKPIDRPSSLAIMSC